jgi:hypothetical protein
VYSWLHGPSFAAYFSLHVLAATPEVKRKLEITIHTGNGRRRLEWVHSSVQLYPTTHQSNRMVTYLFWLSAPETPLSSSSFSVHSVHSVQTRKFHMIYDKLTPLGSQCTYLVHATLSGIIEATPLLPCATSGCIYIP